MLRRPLGNFLNWARGITTGFGGALNYFHFLNAT